ncbi:HU family DNA-binding protein [Thermodesulfobacteriota bacterium]
MNKSDLTKELANELDLPQGKAEEIVDVVFNTMTRALVSDERTEIRGFGSFVIKGYEGYTGRNPQTCEQTMVRPNRLPFFKPGKELKDRVDGKSTVEE